MNQHALKFLLGAAGMVILGFGALYVIPFFSPEYKQEQAAIKKLKEIQDQYANDTYGGETPEETITLFIDALKRGDIDLAAKYFDIEHQGKWKAYLATIRDTVGLKAFFDDAQRLKLSKKDNDQAFFTIATKENIVEVTVILARNNNNKWKIIDL